MNLVDARLRGERILAGEITKHKNDVARLTVFATHRPDMPETIRQDMQEFLKRYDNEPINIKSLHLTESVTNIKVALHHLLEWQS